MILLGGEQTAPNLLPARYFKPERVYILHTDFWKSKQMAERLSLRLVGMYPELVPIDAYDPGKITEQIRSLLHGVSDILVNITGGTKPMSLGALEAARQAGWQPFYVKSQGGKTDLDFYSFSQIGTPLIKESITISDTITLEDYLVAYFGTEFQITGFGIGAGKTFEQTIYETLEPSVDEIAVGWKHASGAVDVDFVVRCNNQVGIIEAKTGGKARTTEGIKQLAIAGGQRFFGTYTRRFLVIDQTWSETSNNRALAEAIDIALIELPSYATSGKISTLEKGKLVGAVQKALGRPVKE
ncbi:MAG: DUF1887 family CARF protein [Chloroflexota bacterium]